MKRFSTTGGLNYLFNFSISRAQGVRAMADLISQSAKYKVNLLDGDNYIVWDRRMKQVLMSKIC